MDRHIGHAGKSRYDRYREFYLGYQMLVFAYASRSDGNNVAHVKPWQKTCQQPEEVRIAVDRLAVPEADRECEPEYKQSNGRLYQRPYPAKRRASVGADKIRLGEFENLLAEGFVFLYY